MNVKEWDLNYRISLGITALLLVWMVLGLIPHDDEEASAPGHHADDFVVQVEHSDAKTYRRPIYVRAVTEANRSVLVSAEVDGLVEATPATEGAMVSNGAALCLLASEDRALRLQQAKAQRNKTQIEYEGALSLNNKGLQSQTQIATAKANLALAEAELSARELAVKKLVVRAPFAGTVQERLVDAGGYIQRGAPCARLVELSPMVVAGEVAESDVIHLAVGDSATINFRSGRKAQGKVRYLSSAANPNTRTFKIEVALPNEDGSLVEGLSADLVIASHAVEAHHISPSLLSLQSDGGLAIKVVDGDVEGENHAVQKTVTIVGDDSDGVWVSGLAPRETIITVGQEYVTHNAKVNVTFAPTASVAPTAEARETSAETEKNTDGVSQGDNS